MPLLLDYWTADLDDSGVLVLRPDSYARDEALAAMLNQAPAVPPAQPDACLAP